MSRTIACLALSYPLSQVYLNKWNTYNILISFVNISLILLACSSEVTVADTGLDDGMSHLAEYFGNYTSPLELDEKNFPWWENGDFAIWNNDGTWIIGLLAYIGTEKGVIKRLSESPCPHPDGFSRADSDWMYQQEDSSWKEAVPLSILVLIGRFIIHILLIWLSEIWWFPFRDLRSYVF